MQGGTSAPGPVTLRYSAVAVFDGTDRRAKAITHLYRGDAFAVLAAHGEFRQVRLPSGTIGFVYATNLIGSDVPATP
jgi:hypothetical protein